MNMLSYLARPPLNTSLLACQPAHAQSNQSTLQATYPCRINFLMTSHPLNLSLSCHRFQCQYTPSKRSEQPSKQANVKGVKGGLGLLTGLTCFCCSQVKPVKGVKGVKGAFGIHTTGRVKGVKGVKPEFKTGLPILSCSPAPMALMPSEG